MPPPAPNPSLRRAAFLAYALALFVATHWPALRFEGPIPRTDLWIHASCFGLWTLLAAGAALFGPALSDRNLHRSLLLALAYAGLDEALQAIPILHRTGALDDFGANALGVLLAGGALLLLARLRPSTP